MLDHEERFLFREEILNLANAGDHIVSSPRLYGGTYNLFHYTLPKLGIETTFVDDPDDLDSWRAAVRPNTKAFFAETISNPQIDVLDIPGGHGKVPVGPSYLSADGREVTDPKGLQHAYPPRGDDEGATLGPSA